MDWGWLVGVVVGVVQSCDGCCHPRFPSPCPHPHHPVVAVGAEGEGGTPLLPLLAASLLGSRCRGTRRPSPSGMGPWLWHVGLAGADKPPPPQPTQPPRRRRLYKECCFSWRWCESDHPPRPGPLGVLGPWLVPRTGLLMGGPQSARTQAELRTMSCWSFADSARQQQPHWAPW